MTTIIIPACNEGASIESTLASLQESIAELNAEVIVVCNGCTDDTADRARRFGTTVRVIESPIGSKTHALNLGDEAAKSFPRIYLDADVLVSPSFVNDVTRALDGDRPLVAYSNVEYDLRGSSAAVRGFYGVWQSMPYNRPGRIGVGMYALNAAGRKRFGAFPQIISDDGFVRGHFTAEECRIVGTCRTIVRAPATLSSLLKIKTRSRLGLFQLRRQHPELLKRHGVTKPWRLPIGSAGRASGLPIYLFVNLVTRVRAAIQSRRLESYRWERDESSRGALAMERT